MYFGSLAIGADCAARLLTMRILSEHKNIKLELSDYQAQLLRPAYEDIIFSCDEGLAISTQAKRVGKDKQTLELAVTAWPSSHPTENPIAKFSFVISLENT